MATALERWQRLGLWVIGRGEDRYPKRLRRVLRNDAPILLYGAGDAARLGLGGLAVVGSRDADQETLAFTSRVVERSVAAGMQIISGGARGIDQAAVRATLEAGGGAVAVLAERLDQTATSRDAKESIRSGQLTLVSPYEPEAHFSVGRAMGRNKDVYALADYALVVRFTTNEGGTWAGAVEQLAQNSSASVRVPVFVRVAGNPDEGWRLLRARGAIPFPESEFLKETVTELLKRTSASSQELVLPDTPAPSTPDTREEPKAPMDLSPQSTIPAPASPAAQPALVSPSGPSSDAGSCYNRCLPLLLQHFQQERSPKDFPEIAHRLVVLIGQLKDWIKRAVEEGKLKKTKKGGRIAYVLVSSPKENSLFDRGGDAA
jgi:predicted Rossmann fold nucleotide-binding protein DprA/Smf involved in DNA uptake